MGFKQPLLFKALFNGASLLVHFLLKFSHFYWYFTYFHSVLFWTAYFHFCCCFFIQTMLFLAAVEEEDQAEEGRREMAEILLSALTDRHQQRQTWRDRWHNIPPTLLLPLIFKKNKHLLICSLSVMSPYFKWKCHHTPIITFINFLNWFDQI